MILLDTHVVIWLSSGDPRLSTAAQSAIDDARQDGRGMAVSDFTLFELTLAFQKKRLGLEMSLESFLFEIEQRFAVLPITKLICVQTLAFPPEYPKDPADRIIGATAVVHGLSLVTADRAIRNSRAVSTIW